MDYEILIPPTMYIRETQPILTDGTQVYVSSIEGQLTDEVGFSISDYKGKKLEHWKGQEAECLLEITKAEFSLPPSDYEEPLPPDCIELKYMGYCDSCHFFPIPDVAIQNDKNLSSLAYRILMEENFTNYGKEGFGLQPFDIRPVMKTREGYALLINKYQFKNVLGKIRKGIWLIARIKEAELLSITEPVERTYSCITEDRLEEKQQEAALTNTKPKKRWSIMNIL